MSSTPHTLLALKAASKSKSINEKQASDRQRDCLVLLFSFLRQSGYFQTAAQLQSEAGSILSRFEAADNIDLIKVVSEYEDFYEIKFKRKPRFSRPSLSNNRGSTSNSHIYSHNNNDNKHVASSSLSSNSRRGTISRANNSDIESRQQVRSTREKTIVNKSLLPNREPISISNLKQNCISTKKERKTNNNTKYSTRNGVMEMSKEEKHVDKIFSSPTTNTTLHVQGRGDTKEVNQSNNNDNQNGDIEYQSANERIIKPLPSFGDNFELRSLAASIQSEILDTSPEVNWDDVIALDDAKRLLKEAVILPMKYPDLFSGLLVPWRGVLLYGPPGTGKTLLAKAVATEGQTTFFNISASSIVSKFRGESEKLIKVLFELARYHSPSTIFLDEIDSIMGHRGGCGGSNAAGGGGGEGSEHEGSRRMKTELLIQMDGLGNGRQHVFVLAASNTPWDLDQALLRRLEKRIIVPMPDEATRKELLKSYLSLHACQLEEKDFDVCAQNTEGYNCADIKLLCKEAAMKPVRSIFKHLEKDTTTTNNKTKGVGKVIGVQSSSCTDTTTRKYNTTSCDLKALLMKNPITSEHLLCSLENTKPSTDSNTSQKYKEWSESHGAM